MSLLGAATIFSVGNTTRVAREHSALARAEILDCGRRTYSFSRTDAAAVWASTAEAGRLALLIQAGAVSVPADFLNAPGGYVLSLSGSVADATVVRCNGEVLPR